MKSFTVFTLLVVLSVLLNGQSSTPDSDRPLLIEEVHVSGTRSLDTTELNEIIGPLNQLKVAGTEEIRERLRFQFQDYGFFNAELKSLRVKTNDPLASMPPVTVEAEVVEGSRFRIGDILFTGIHALTADELRPQFPIHGGEYFSRTKVGRGLEALRDIYGKIGYINFSCVPDTSVADDRVSLHIDVQEGRQFRMGSLELVGNPQIGEQLRLRWELEMGKPYDTTYLSKFFHENESLFPPQFDLSNSTKIAKNCQDHTVTVFIELGPNHPPITAPSSAGCHEDSITASP